MRTSFKNPLVGPRTPARSFSPKVLDGRSCVEVSAVEPEDVPSEIGDELLGVGRVADFALSPIDAPKFARSFFDRAVNAYAKAVHGAIEDLQIEVVRMPSGVKRYDAPGGDRISVIAMSWWIDHDALRDRAKLDAVLDLMKAKLPESMPRRYGYFEPPPFKLAVDGEAHFREFMRYAIKKGAVVCPTRPVVGWYVRNEDGPGPTLLGYCANSLEIQIEANTLAQLGWERQLRSFWRDMSVLLHPFYGDVLLLGGFELRGGTTYGGESHPVPGFVERRSER